MRKCVWSFGIVLTAVGLAGAVQDSPHEKALKTAVESLDKIGATLKTIVDEDSAGASRPELKKAAAAFLEARERGDKLPPPEKEEKERLKKLYKPKLEEAMRKIQQEVRRVDQIPGGREALKEISGVFKKDGK